MQLFNHYSNFARLKLPHLHMIIVEIKKFTRKLCYDLYIIIYCYCTIYGLEVLFHDRYSNFRNITLKLQNDILLVVSIV